MTSHRKKVLFLTRFSMMLALEVIVCFASSALAALFGPVGVALLPVIATSLLMGTAAGTLLGLFSGIFNLLIWSFVPSAPAMAFFFSPVQSFGDIHGNGWSVAICILPRVLCGAVTGLLAKAFRRGGCKDGIVYGASGALGSLTNTFSVTGMMVFCFGPGRFSAAGPEFKVLLTTVCGMILANGIPEAVLGALTGTAVCRPISQHLH